MFLTIYIYHITITWTAKTPQTHKRNCSKELLSLLFLKQLKLSNFLIFKGECLCNLIPVFNTRFWNNAVLQKCVCRSYFLLVLWSWITKFCLKFPLCCFMKHKTSKTYSDATIRILFSLYFRLQDSCLFTRMINLVTFFWMCSTFIFSPAPPQI
jgi:hypothetical protein